MSYSERKWFPFASFHITLRGDRKNDIFLDDKDFQVYLKIISEALEYFDNQYEIFCYCFMDNHVHLLVKTKEKHIKYFMARISSIYTKYFNGKYNYAGHIY